MINYDVPSKVEQYLQRVGTPEGMRRVAVNFVTNTAARAMRDIGAYYKVELEEMPMDIDDLIADMVFV